MKIAVISDSHDNLATVEKFTAFAETGKIESVIHCGDVASGETLEFLAKKYGGTINIALGNADFEEQLADAGAKFGERLKIIKGFGRLEIGGLKIGFCHYLETAKRHCEKERLDFAFYGHSHKPWMETLGSCVLANPGTLAGVLCKATFAVLDAETKKLSLKIIERL